MNGTSPVASIAGRVLLLLFGGALAAVGVAIFAVTRDAGALLPYGISASVVALVLGLALATFALRTEI